MTSWIHSHRRMQEELNKKGEEKTLRGAELHWQKVHETKDLVCSDLGDNGTEEQKSLESKSRVSGKQKLKRNMVDTGLPQNSGTCLLQKC